MVTIIMGHPSHHRDHLDNGPVAKVFWIAPIHGLVIPIVFWLLRFQPLDTRIQVLVLQAVERQSYGVVVRSLFGRVGLDSTFDFLFQDVSRFSFLRRSDC